MTYFSFLQIIIIIFTASVIYTSECRMSSLIMLRSTAGITSYFLLSEYQGVTISVPVVVISKYTKSYALKRKQN